MKLRKVYRSGFLFILAILALGIGAYAFALYSNPNALDEQQYVVDKGQLPNLWHSMLWIHAVSAGTALSIGWLQFIKRLRVKLLHVHRVIGMLYMVMAAVGAISGLYLAAYADGGWSGKLGFTALSLMWGFTLFRGIHSILSSHKPMEHGRWMLRNYALTCAAIMLRIYVPLAEVLFGISDTNITFSVIAWLCWVPNLLVAELVIYLTRSLNHLR